MEHDEAAVVRRAVDEEVAKREAFHNWHGITAENFHQFLVPPFQVRVDPDDLETQTRLMWVVLQEASDPTDGHVVVYDPADPDSPWGVADHVRDGEYILVVGAASLADALTSM